MQEPKTKCSEAGFAHAWEDTTPNVCFPTFPPKFPDRQETCKNCGLKRFHKVQTIETIEYSLPL